MSIVMFQLSFQPHRFYLIANLQISVGNIQNILTLNIYCVETIRSLSSWTVRVWHTSLLIIIFSFCKQFTFININEDNTKLHMNFIFFKHVTCSYTIYFVYFHIMAFKVCIYVLVVNSSTFCLPIIPQARKITTYYISILIKWFLRTYDIMKYKTTEIYIFFFSHGNESITVTDIIMIILTIYRLITHNDDEGYETT